MASGYEDYRPLLLRDASLKRLTSRDFRQFVFRAGIVPGIHLLMHRQRLRPDWPYVDTKFAPDTGQDLRENSYEVLYPWLLCRAVEALIDHQAVLHWIDGLSLADQDEISPVFAKLWRNMAAVVEQILDRNNGRCPFRVNRQLRAIDASGQPVAMDPEHCGPGDLLATGAMLVAGPVARGREMITRNIELVQQDRHDEPAAGENPPGPCRSMRVVLLGTMNRACRYSSANRHVLLPKAIDLLQDMLDHSYDPQAMLFHESDRRDSREPTKYVYPGDSIQFVSAGLLTIEHILSAGSSSLYEQTKPLITRVRSELPQLLVKTGWLAFNRIHPGIYRCVDSWTGRAIDTEMPSSLLPLTMRAAIQACRSGPEDTVRKECLELFVRCHNAYFGHYLNRSYWLFPYQAMDGRTAQIVRSAAEEPEADPLYYSNLPLMEILAALEGCYRPAEQ